MRSSVTVTGPPRCDLAAEDRHHAAGAAEHVAEAHRRVARSAGSAPWRPRARHSASALEAPITVGGRDRLVGGDEHEAPHAVLARDVRDDARGDRVVAHRLDGVGLHQPHVLVGGGVEDDRRARARRTPRACARPPCSRPARLRARWAGRGARPRSSRWISNRLSSAWSSSTSRRGATRAICRHSSEPIEPPAPVTSTVGVPQIGADAIQLHDAQARARARPRPAPRAPGARPWSRLAGLQQLEHGRQRAHGDAALAALAHHARAHAARRGGDRDDHLLRLGLLEDARQIALRVAAHADAIDAQPALARIVVEKPHRREPELAVAHDLAQHQAPAVAGAHDQHRPARPSPTPRKAASGRRSWIERATTRTPTSSTSAQQQEQHDHPVGQAHRDDAVVRGAICTGRITATATTVSSTIAPPRALSPVVALPRIAPAALVDAREREHHARPPGRPTRSCVRADPRTARAARCRSAAGKPGSRRARPAPRPQPAGGASGGAERCGRGADPAAHQLDCNPGDTAPAACRAGEQ